MPQVVINEQAWLLLGNILYHFDQAVEGKKLSPFLNKRYISVPRGTEKKYFETFVCGLIEKYHVYAEGFDIKTYQHEATPIIKLVHLNTGSQLQLLFQTKNFKGQLRPYQKAGYNWFHFLQHYKFGGVLADDMGLGKTIQTLALLQKQKEDAGEDGQPHTSILILPTSLIYNWQKEASKFAPKLRILLHTGTNRIKDNFSLSHFDLVITTYGIVRSDEEMLEKFYFNYIILDESQNIKNPASKSFKAIKSLKSRHKLALSGTPVENSVSDLWAQMPLYQSGL
ncbi:hypothetical protein FQR65_LT16045 [Abscondita terminalis]|nr:hypothetical protein FQR65_LT16045 [Abscondita terminalis]